MRSAGVAESGSPILRHSSLRYNRPVPTIVLPELSEETRQRIAPPYRVVLHNDDENSMDHVVRSLTRSVPGTSVERAAEIMLEAHNHAQATVIVCHKELAELYRERLENCALTATIEPE